MNDYILLMHDNATDVAASEDSEKWGKYISALRGSGQFDGGSSIGKGESLRIGQPPYAAETRITGFIRVRAADLEDAKSFLQSNPVYEAGGTVEVRELPQD